MIDKVADLTDEEIDAIIAKVRDDAAISKMCGCDTAELRQVWGTCALFGEEIKRLRVEMRKEK